jgi:hypothetical protein
VGDFYSAHQELVDMVYYVYGTVIPIVTCAVVIATTCVTAFKVRQAALWRAKMSSATAATNKATVATFAAGVNVPG